ncbi:CDP-diacylglycerol--serine O-phosphatidyltransferase [Suttonella sp. R2A3]|uniref:CDP-diacylglycerol--serine O-phosphatidyltransferase n=1 Tax=Suttonella sp. R2A3 TaxID=2908648 RepID=UPI001F368FAA|nr:CDP-diacylglycerol--serine O-phosphatidyltransferase [Suttonella sp. R2A3]UJF25003.1 CDP-diacylglycerol--serine O-phosphatidyltransferase [Suttonella sp. R2A3]
MKGYRTIYILPNAVTTAALFCGFYAILAAINGRFDHAAVLIFVAMIFDGFDGRVARWTKTESDFGVQYDSLSDLISFGVAPSILIYQWALHGSISDPLLPTKLGAMSAFIYTACAALRLARFNIQVEQVDKAFFVGLPSPAAAAVVTSFVWVGARYDFAMSQYALLPAIIVVCVGLAMVANISYYSFKTFKLEGRIPFSRAFVPAAIIALIFLEPPLMLFLIFGAYALHGPLWSVWRYWRRQRKKAHD